MSGIADYRLIGAMFNGYANRLCCWCCIKLGSVFLAWRVLRESSAELSQTLPFYFCMGKYYFHDKPIRQCWKCNGTEESVAALSILRWRRCTYSDRSLWKFSNQKFIDSILADLIYEDVGSRLYPPYEMLTCSAFAVNQNRLRSINCVVFNIWEYSIFIFRQEEFRFGRST